MTIDKVSSNKLIGFNDKYHKYFFIDESRRHLSFKSVTQFTKSLEVEFELEEKSLKQAKELGVTQEEIKDKWEKHRIQAAVDGTYVHSKLEHLALYKMPITLERWHPKLNGAFQFYEDYLNNKKYKLIACEEILYYLDEVTNTYYAGQRDLVLEEVSTGRILSIDYKTNETIRYKSFYNTKLKGKEYLRGTFNYLQSCNYNTYTVQLNTYKFMDCSNNPKSLSKADEDKYDSYICHITPTGYSMLKVDDLSISYNQEAKEFVSNKKQVERAININRFLLD